MKVSVWISRFAAIAIVIAIAGALWLLLALPFINSFMDHRESIAQSQEMLAKYRQLDVSRAQIDTKLQQLHNDQQTEGRLLTGGSVQLVGAKLQNSLKETIEANKGNLVSMQMLPPRDEDGFRRLTLGVNLSANMESLQQILYAIEDQSPYLFIEDMELRTSGAVDDTTNPEIQVEFEVFGYMPVEAQ